MDYAALMSTLNTDNYPVYDGINGLTFGNFTGADLFEEGYITMESKPLESVVYLPYEFTKYGDKVVAKVPDLVAFFQIYGFVTAPINVFGIVVIWCGSTEAMSDYRWHLLNFQVWSTFFEFIMCSLVTNLPEFTNILDFSTARFYGLLTTQFGASLFVCTIFMCIPVVFLFLSIAQCFAYRHQALLGADSRFKLQPKTFNLILLLVYFLALLGVSLLLHNAYRLYIDEIIDIRDYDMDESFDNYYRMNPNIISKVVFLPAMTIMVVGILLIVTLTISSTYILLSSSRDMSAKTKSMQWSFIRVLCLQTGIPLFVIVIPLMYRLVKEVMPREDLNLTHEQMMERTTREPQVVIVWAAIHCHGLLATFTLLLLKPYRNYVKKMLCLVRIMNRFTTSSGAAYTGADETTKSVAYTDTSVV